METMSETTYQYMTRQTVGYPNYGTPNPSEVITNSPPPAYNHPFYLHCRNSPLEQPCCTPSRVHPVNEINGNAEREVEDYFMLKPPLKVTFSSVFHEPDHTGGVGFISTFNGIIYYCSKRSLYVFLSCIVGPIMAVSFGILFALIDFLVIWCLNPSVRLIQVCVRFVSGVHHPLTRVLLDPVFESVGQRYLFRNSGSFTERKYKVDVSDINLGVMNSSSRSSDQHTV